MAYSRESVIESYQKIGTLKGVCADTGAPPYTAFIWLKKAGMLTNSDSVKYGTTGSRRGAEAEKEFQRLVPKAMNANRELQGNCPSFDFEIDGVTVDVKYSSIRQSTGSFGFKVGKKTLQPNFFAVFLPKTADGELRVGQYNLLLIPYETIAHRKCVTINTNGKGDLWDFEIPPKELAGFFDQ